MGRLLAPHMAAIAQGTDIVHNVFMGREAFSFGVMLAARNAGKPFVFTPLRHKRPLGWNSPAFRAIYRQADAVIAMTEGEAAWLERQGAPKQRLHVIGLGPQNDPTASPALAFKAIGGRHRFVLFLGQLHEYKGYHALLDAAHRLESRDVLFVFAGPDVRNHARRIQRAGANVLWLGAVDDALRDSLLSACSVVCVPSSRESFGIIAVEAWASGKPVIGGPAAATRELIEDGVDGWAVAQDPVTIAARIAQLLDNEELARDMGSRGKEKVGRRFTWESVATRTSTSTNGSSQVRADDRAGERPWGRRQRDQHAYGARADRRVDSQPRSPIRLRVPRALDHGMPALGRGPTHCQRRRSGDP
jgi:glycosyltransferase involved in cell wall biosynthesis